MLLNLVREGIYTVLLKISELYKAHFPFVTWLHAMKANTELTKKKKSLRILSISLSTNFNLFQIKLK